MSQSRLHLGLGPRRTSSLRDLAYSPQGTDVSSGAWDEIAGQWVYDLLPGTAADELKTEDGGFLLQEDGSYIQLGGGLTGTAADELLNEDGTFLLQEDGSYIQLDAATGDVSLSGETLVVTVTLVDGGVTGTASVTGETLSVTPTLTDGAVAAAANVTGETLTATPSLTDGAVTGTAAVTGETLTASPTLTDGAVTGTAEVSGETLSVTVTLIDGSVQTDGNASINGEVLTATPVLIEGSATGTASVAGEVLSVSPALIDGTVSTDGSVTVDGEVLAVSLVLIDGEVSIIGEPGTERPPKPPGGDDAPRSHVGIAPKRVKDKYERRGIDRDDLVAIYEQVVEGKGPKKVVAAVRKAIKPHVPEGEPSLPEPEVLDWSAIERDLRVRVALQRMQRALEDEEDAITVLLLGAA